MMAFIALLGWVFALLFAFGTRYWVKRADEWKSVARIWERNAEGWRKLANKAETLADRQVEIRARIVPEGRTWTSLN